MVNCRAGFSEYCILLVLIVNYHLSLSFTLLYFVYITFLFQAAFPINLNVQLQGVLYLWI